MPTYLGIDTGGTFTDAVLFAPDTGVCAAAKALTTKHDLSIGIAHAVDLLLEPFSSRPAIDLVSISTTLATNAIVEGQGSPVCLILIGQDPDILRRYGLHEVLGSDPVVFVGGGHTHAGDERMTLEEVKIMEAVDVYKKQVAAFAVVSYFGVLNPAHEKRAAEIIRECSGLPVCCSHHLTNRLNAARRAVTCVLNGRLVPLIDELLSAVRVMLYRRGIRAPLMVVQGNGSLVAADVARLRPVETILSGPAASAVGAAFLSEQGSAVTADMGGTTTDLCLLENGSPRLSADGAVVAGWRTMVEAVDVETVGLGGDSEIVLDPTGSLTIGPQRAVPLSLLASEFPEVLAILRQQLRSTKPDPYAGRFVLRQRSLDTDYWKLGKLERQVWDVLDRQPVPLGALLNQRERLVPLQALRRRGLIAVAAFTPSDAAHVLGEHTHWSREAAELGARLLARRLTGGRGSSEDLCHRVFRQIQAQISEVAVRHLLGGESRARPTHASDLDSQLIRRALAGEQPGPLQIQLSLQVPLVAVGAPAATYFPAVGARLGAQVIVPRFAEVCNAVGAVVAGVVQRAEARITAPRRDLYRVHLDGLIEDFLGFEEAVEYATEELIRIVRRRVEEAGGRDIEVSITRQDRIGKDHHGTDIFVESQMRAVATGRPSIAGD